MLKNNFFLYLAFILLLTSFATTSQELKLPDLGTPSDKILSPVKEAEIRDEIVKQIYQYNLVITDPFIAGYMEDLGFRISSKSSKPLSSFDFFIVNQNIVNASAYPGGLIVFYSGLFLKTDTESELASVMAHEVAHATQRHISRAYAENQKNLLPTILGLLGAAAASQSSSSKDAPIAIATATMAMQQQAMINFTRENEYEADRVGIGILAKAGFDPNGMADFFGKLMQNRPLDPRYQSGEYQRTHPLSINRVTEAKNRSKSLNVKEVSESVEYPFIKERLRVLTQKNELDHVNYYEELFLDTPQSEITEAQKYGHAYSLFKSNQPQKALKKLKEVKKEPGNKLLIEVLNANILTRIELEKGLRQFDELLDFYPDNSKVLIPYIEALSHSKELKHLTKARRLARQLTQIDPENPDYFQILAVVNQNSNKTIEASEAMATREHLIKNNYRAVRILKNTLKSDLSYFQRARIEAKIIEFEALITQEERRKERLADRLGRME